MGVVTAVKESSTVRTPRRRALTRLVLALPLVVLAAYLSAGYYIADTFSRPVRWTAPAPSLISGAYENVSFVTSDGLTLKGWFFPASTREAIVMVHGRDQNRVEYKNKAERVAAGLRAAGYSILMFDMRGHGESDGDRFTGGYQERRDVAAAVDFLVRRGFAERSVGLVGISLGAVSALATLTLMPGLGPVVADSSWEDLGLEISEGLEYDKHLPTVLAPATMFAVRVFLGYDTDAVRPLDIVRAHPERAFLFIHCDQDPLINVHHGRDLRAASTNPASDLWIATGCYHAAASENYPDEYVQRVLAFLRRELGSTN